MSSLKYQVLWIDDKHEGMPGFKMQARQQGINLITFKSVEAGFAELETNYPLYDAVILDAKFFETENDVAGDEKLSALRKAKEKIAKLPKLFEPFVLTGQAKLFDDETFQSFVPQYYRKGISEDINELFTAIKEACNNQEDTKIRHQYPKAFEACAVIGGGVQKPLLQILKSIHNPIDSFDDELYFTQIRIILEHLFRAANKHGLLHDKCLEGGKVNLSESSLFLAGRSCTHLSISCRKAHFPKIIADNVWSIIAITGSASHTEDDVTKQNRASIADYRKYIDTPYLLYSLTFQLIDILIWFQNYVNDNKNYGMNVALWNDEFKAKEILYTGLIEQDGSGDYYCGDYQLNNSYTEKKYKVGDKISILEASNNTGYKKQTHPYFANKFIKAHL